MIQVKDIENDNKGVLDKILSASIHLINIQSDPSDLRVESDGTYSGVYGDFCQLKFKVHKQDPSSVPMFRDLVAHSPDCDKHRYRVDLGQVAQLARSFDNEDGAVLGLTKSLILGGVVFHESRCGSTLVANALIGMNPQKHRVYSESAPPIVALRQVCGETYSTCSLETASRILQDALYLMGRTNDLQEERVFFKIQSVGTRSIEVFQHAFPGTPWMFVYRDPVQVLMSQMAHGKNMANCLRGRQQPPTSVATIATRSGFNVRNLSSEEYCAAHLVRYDCVWSLLLVERVWYIILVSQSLTYTYRHHSQNPQWLPWNEHQKWALVSIMLTCQTFCTMKFFPIDGTLPFPKKNRTILSRLVVSTARDEAIVRWNGTKTASKKRNERLLKYTRRQNFFCSIRMIYSKVKENTMMHYRVTSWS